MEKKTNIAELLKDCPRGTKLYSPLCGECEYVCIENIFIKIKDIDDYVHSFFSDGRRYKNGECVLFPSKENRDWSTFKIPFKDGDIVSTRNGIWIGIVKKPVNYSYETYITINGESLIYDHPIFCFERLATEEEKEKLFQAIKDKGYKWNAETKTLEKLVEPKFKVGDIIKTIYKPYKYIIKEITDTHYTLEEVEDKFQYMEPIIEDKNWKLVPKVKIGDKIRKKGEYSTYTITDVKYEHYCCGKYVICNIHEDDLELVPDKFDITTLVPFESKVLVRDADHEWEGAVFGRYNGDSFFTIGGINWGQCIPYEGNEHLFGKTDDCDEFYKTWE